MKQENRNYRRERVKSFGGESCRGRALQLWTSCTTATGDEQKGQFVRRGAEKRFRRDTFRTLSLIPTFCPFLARFAASSLVEKKSGRSASSLLFLSTLSPL